MELDMKRVRSSYSFPYARLKEAEELVTAIHSLGAPVQEVTDVIKHLNLKIPAGKLRVYAARDFGLVEHQFGKLKLTSLGKRLADKSYRKTVLVKAFLHVELFKILFKKYEGRRLPNNIEMELCLRKLGIIPSCLSKARLSFTKSLEYAGFLDEKDPFVSYPTVKEFPVQKRKTRVVVPDNLLLQELIKMLPPLESEFPVEKQVAWLKIMEYCFDRIYKRKDSSEVIEITIQNKLAP